MITTRTVTTDECPWLDADIPKDTEVYFCRQPTYGCIGYDGFAATFDPDGGYPFFELPKDSV